MSGTPADRLNHTSQSQPQESLVTTTVAPEPKTTTPASSPLPPSNGRESAARIPVAPGAEDALVPAPWTPDLPPALLVEHVTKRFRVDRRKPPVLAIEDVSLRLERGSIHGILGANGSGKSTLIRLVSGLLTLDEGRVAVFGLDLERDELAVKRLINRVSVDAAFFKKLSPMENLLFAARLYGLDAGDAKRQATAILARLGIARSRLGRPVEQMSRGMQQKVAIARALLTSPTLLLLDEPTTGLDPRSKLDVQAFVEEVNASHGATIVLTTHDLGEAERLCDRITILDGGRVVAEDTPDGLKARVAIDHGQPPTLEAVFMTYTGRSLDDDLEDDAQEDER
jgi:ABC-2 type transport system ATP-binding protein